MKVESKNRKLFLVLPIFGVMAFLSPYFSNTLKASAASDVSANIINSTAEIGSSGAAWNISGRIPRAEAGDFIVYKMENVTEINIPSKLSKDGVDFATVSAQNVIRNADLANSYTPTMSEDVKNSIQRGSQVFDLKITFNENASKFQDLDFSISTKGANHSTMVNQDWTSDSKISLAGNELAKRTNVHSKQPVTIDLATGIRDGHAEYNQNFYKGMDIDVISGVSNPMKKGYTFEVELDDSAPIRYNPVNLAGGSYRTRGYVLRNIISPNTPVNVNGVYLTDGSYRPAVDMIKSTETTQKFVVVEDFPARNLIYRGTTPGIKIIDGSKIVNDKITEVTGTIRIFGADGQVVKETRFNRTINIMGGSAGLSAIVRPPAPQPAQPAQPVPQQPAEQTVDLPKTPSEPKIETPNTGFEKSNIFLAVPVLGVLTLVTYWLVRKK